MEKWREELYVDALCHHGILGQKWGIRRFQNKDGTLTSLGRTHYGAKSAVLNKKEQLSSDMKELMDREDKIVNGISKKMYKNGDYPINARIYMDCLIADKMAAQIRNDPMDDINDLISSYNESVNREKKVLESASSELDSIAALEKNKYYNDIVKRYKQVVDGMINKDEAAFQDFEYVYSELVQPSLKSSTIRNKLADIDETIFESMASTQNSYGDVVKAVATRFAPLQNKRDKLHASGIQGRVARILVHPDDAIYSEVLLEQEISDLKQYSLEEKLFGKQVKHSAMNDSDYKDIGRQWVEELSDGLEHYNTKGSKWGNRRYQNKDGSLTPLGRIHYGVGAPREGGGKYESGSSKMFGGRGGKFARKSASREDEVISRMKDIHERDASERDQWNREVSESVAKNVQSIMENERARKAEPDDLRRMREENESIAKMLDGISDKDFDSVVSDMVDKADLGKGVKAASKYIDKDSVSNAAKAAADAAKNGQNPDAAFATSLIEGVGKNVRKNKVSNGGGPSGQDAAKAAISFFERYKDLPNALNSLGGHAGKISSLYSDVKAYQRLKSVDLNSMSDDDLRNAVNRLTLEQDYISRVSKNVGVGERRVNNFINGAGASLQIGGSIVQLANAISKARKKY